MACPKNWSLDKKRKATKRYQLKTLYNLTVNEYNKLVERQNGLCAICGKVETANNQYGMFPLSIDHDHITGKVRGLLCQRCNRMLGHAKDNINILKKAIKYLRRT